MRGASICVGLILTTLAFTAPTVTASGCNGVNDSASPSFAASEHLVSPVINNLPSVTLTIHGWVDGPLIVQSAGPVIVDGGLIATPGSGGGITITAPSIQLTECAFVVAASNDRLAADGGIQASGSSLTGVLETAFGHAPAGGSVVFTATTIQADANSLIQGGDGAHGVSLYFTGPPWGPHGPVAHGDAAACVGLGGPCGTETASVSLYHDDDGDSATVQVGGTIVPLGPAPDLWPLWLADSAHRAAASKGGDVLLTSASSLILHGTVRAGNGGNSAPITVGVALPVDLGTLHAPGGLGGAVVLTGGTAVNADGFVKSGNGGLGSVFTGGWLESIQATGGSGGDGGPIVLNAPTAAPALDGTWQRGAGGPGGDALADATTLLVMAGAGGRGGAMNVHGAFAPVLPGGIVLDGGSGGNGGLAQTIAGVNSLTQGGRGGDAGLVRFNGVLNLAAACTPGDGGGADTRAPSGVPPETAPGADGQTIGLNGGPGEPAQAGIWGANAGDARGGDGGIGCPGGGGGLAESRGGFGGGAGRSGDGAPGCLSGGIGGLGNAGGLGGSGGKATGGRGGDGVPGYWGGPGGTARSFGGRGGDGGDGGNGGNTGPTGVVGPAGEPGQGGPGGEFGLATGGAPGQGIGSGTPPPAGGSTMQPGPNGEDGTIGTAGQHVLLCI